MNNPVNRSYRHVCQAGYVNYSGFSRFIVDTIYIIVIQLYIEFHSHFNDESRVRTRSIIVTKLIKYFTPETLLLKKFVNVHGYFNFL